MKSKHFGRTLSMPSKIEIKRELMMMCLADELCSGLQSNGVTSDGLASILKELIDQHDISSERAKIISDMHRARNAAMFAAAGELSSEIDRSVSK